MDQDLVSAVRKNLRQTVKAMRQQLELVESKSRVYWERKWALGSRSALSAGRVPASGAGSPCGGFGALSIDLTQGWDGHDLGWPLLRKKAVSLGIGETPLSLPCGFLRTVMASDTRCCFVVMAVRSDFSPNCTSFPPTEAV